MSLIDELKRRNVFKVGLAYLALGWVVIQVTDIAVPTLNLPETLTTIVFYLGLIGFPFALLFAWAFELTPEGLARTAEVDPKQSVTSTTGQKINYIIIGVLAIGIAFLLYDKAMTPAEMHDEVASVSPDTSIAVLPFVDMSQTGDQEYFSDGISEEILNVLAKIPDLHVTSRSSAFSFKGKDMEIPDIASALGVKHVLEGSVRKSGDTVRITAQLIEADSDKHLWSETYDRQLTDIFKVQDEISIAIVEALKAELGIEIDIAAHETNSVNAAAYDLYLHGLEGLRNSTFQSLGEALVALRGALAIEPDFVNAQLTLATVLIESRRIGMNMDLATINEAMEIANSVLSKDPTNARAYVILGYAYRDVRAFGDRREANRKAYELDPNNAEIIVSHLDVEGAIVPRSEALSKLARAERIDPYNHRLMRQLAALYARTLNDKPSAERLYKRAHELNPKDGNSMFNLAEFYADRFADIVSAHDALTVIYGEDPNDPDDPNMMVYFYSSLGDYETALEYSKKALEVSPHYARAHMQKAIVLMLMGHSDEALEIIEGAFANENTLFRPGDRDMLGLLASSIHITRGDLDAAEQALYKGNPRSETWVSDPVEFFPQTRSSHAVLYHIFTAQGRLREAEAIKAQLQLDPTRWQEWQSYEPTLFSLEIMARTSANVADEDVVFGYLEALAAKGAFGNWKYPFKLDPAFFNYHDHPRFKAIVASLEADAKRQLEVLRARIESGQSVSP